MNASSTPSGSVRIGISALRTCSRKTKMTDAHDDHLFDERVPERAHRFFDERGAVVRGDDLHSFRQAPFDLLQPFLDRVDDVERVLAVAHDHDAARRFAFAVELGEAAPDVRADADLGDVLDANGRAAPP